MHIVGYDAKVWKAQHAVGSGFGAERELIARLREIRFTLDREFIDVAGINQMPMPYWRVGEANFEITATQLIDAIPEFADYCLQGNEVFITFKWEDGPDGTEYGPSFYAYIGTSNVNFSGRSDVATEEITLRPSRPDVEGITFGLS